MPEDHNPREPEDRWRRQAAAADAAEIAAHGFTRVPSRTVLVDLLTRLRREAFAECSLADEVEGVLRQVLEAASPATSLRRRDTDEHRAFWDFIERSAAEGRALLERTHPTYQQQQAAVGRLPALDALIQQWREEAGHCEEFRDESRSSSMHDHWGATAAVLRGTANELEAVLAGLRADPAPRQQEETKDVTVSRVETSATTPTPGSTAKISTGDK